MALFAELDPDPVIRINPKGEIILLNNAAQLLIGELGLSEEKNIFAIIPVLDFSINEFINQNKLTLLTFKTTSKSYSIHFIGIASLQIAQLYFHDITEKEDYENALRNLSAKLLDLIEDERHRIARELHDGIGQNLLLLKMDLMHNYKQFISQHVNESIFQETLDLLHNTISEIKNILYGLKPPILEEIGLSLALASMISKVSEESPIRGNLNVMGLNYRLDKRLELSVYRIIQEAINNIIKHSQADTFFVELANNEYQLKIVISDNGIGISGDNHIGFGLLNIKERVNSFNGSYKIDSEINKGTCIKIEIPLTYGNKI